MVNAAAIVSASALLATVAPAVLAAPLVQTENSIVERELEPFLSERDIADLAEREPFLPLLFGAGRLISGAVGAIKNRKKKRDLEDLDLMERDFEDELAEREPFLPLLFGAGRLISGAVGAIKNRKKKRDLEDFELSERDIADLAEREPFLPLLFGAGRLISGAVGAIKNRKKKRDLEDVDLMEREFEGDFDLRDYFENLEDFELRDFEDDILDAREGSLDELD